MIYLKKLAFFTIALILFKCADAQKVTNIQPKLVGNNMEITYEIADADFNQRFKIELFVSTDGGKTYKGPMTLISDSKKEILAGVNTIVWDIFKDLTSLDMELFFDIQAEVIEQKIERSFFVQYSAGALVSSIDYITPIGFRLGMLGKTGWYVAGYFNSFANADYSFDGKSMESPVFYEFTKNDLYPRMVVTAGFTFQLNWQSYLYAGAGYGTKKYYSEIIELGGNDLTPQGNTWVNMSEFEESGIEIEAGTIFKFGKFSFSAGVSGFNFKQLGANASIGVAF
jgi:hypothetical protein